MNDPLEALESQGFAYRDRRDDWGEFCCLCGSREMVADHHWVHTRKARPDLIDFKLNRLPLCWKCHVIPHTIGRVAFYKKNKNRLPLNYRDYFEKEVGVC